MYRAIDPAGATIPLLPSALRDAAAAKRFFGKALSDSIAHQDAEGLELLHDSENKIQVRGVGDPEGTYKMAEAYAVLGDKASALRMLRYSIEHGFFSWPYFISDPLLSNVRNEPQFKQLMTIARERRAAFERAFF